GGDRVASQYFSSASYVLSRHPTPLVAPDGGFRQYTLPHYDSGPARALFAESIHPRRGRALRAITAYALGAAAITATRCWTTSAAARVPPAATQPHRRAA